MQLMMISQIRNLIQNLIQNLAPNLTVVLPKRIPTMAQCLTIAMSVDKTRNSNINALIHRTESRKDLTSSLRSKKQNTFTKIQSSPSKMQSDGMTIHTPMDLVFRRMRTVSTGKEFAMNLLLLQVTRSGVKMAYPYTIFDKVRLEIAGSWQRRAH